MQLQRIFKNQWFYVGVIFLVSLCFCWPGIMEPDSQSVYQEAITKVYTPSHPPLQALLWGWLAVLHPGPSLMLTLQWILLWGAIAFGVYLYKKSLWSWWFIFTFLWPSLFLFERSILKDVQFSFGYLLLIMWCAKQHRQKNGFSFWTGLLFMLILFYATAIKYQARFLLPFLTCWFAVIQLRSLSFLRPILFGSLLTGIILGAVHWTTASLVKKEHETHFWQFVKIYDLAGMSVYSQRVLVPPFLWRQPDVTWEEIAKEYGYQWEPLINKADSPLSSTKNDAERTELKKTWKRAILNHPYSYLRHRFRNWLSIMLDLPWRKMVNWLKAHNLPPSLTYVLAPSPFSFILYLPFAFFFIGLGFYALRKTWAAVPLLMLNSMALTLVGVLFIFSLAGVPRYIFFSFCCLVFSPPFAFSCLKSILRDRKKRKESKDY